MTTNISSALSAEKKRPKISPQISIWYVENFLHCNRSISYSFVFDFLSEFPRSQLTSHISLMSSMVE